MKFSPEEAAQLVQRPCGYCRGDHPAIQCREFRSELAALASYNTLPIRYVKEGEKIPEARCNFSVGAGTHTVVKKIPIDRIAARRGK